MVNSFSDPDERTSEQYTLEVNEYVLKMTDYYAKLLDMNYVLGGHGAFAVDVSSDSETPYKDVEIVVRIEGARALLADEADDNLPEFPAVPHPFGARRKRNAPSRTGGVPPTRMRR